MNCIIVVKLKVDTNRNIHVDLSKYKHIHITIEKMYAIIDIQCGKWIDSVLKLVDSVHPWVALSLISLMKINKP